MEAMTEAEVVHLVQAWIALHRTSPERRSADDPNDWAFGALYLLEFKDPEQCWNVVLKLMDSASDEDLIAAIAAGPVESLLAHHGEKVIDRVERHAADDPKFRSMLSGVWRNAISDDVWTRISAIQNRDDNGH